MESICKNCHKRVVLVNFAMGPKWMHHPVGAAFQDGMYESCQLKIAEPADADVCHNPECPKTGNCGGACAKDFNKRVTETVKLKYTGWGGCCCSGIISFCNPFNHEQTPTKPSKEELEELRYDLADRLREGYRSAAETLHINGYSAAGVWLMKHRETLPKRPVKDEKIVVKDIGSL
jgi:hypothetical protein